MPPHITHCKRFRFIQKSTMYSKMALQKTVFEYPTEYPTEYASTKNTYFLSFRHLSDPSSFHSFESIKLSSIVHIRTQK